MTAGAMLFVLLSGALFGAGLAVSTMIQPEVVLSFLRGQDLGLMLVMAGGVAVTMLAYRLAPKVMARPWTAARFGAHAASLDRRTVLGAALFGVGWGLCGVCPGPAIAGLGAGNWPLVYALLGLFAGAWLQGRFFAPRA
ncbi:MAG: DUF6691 family protein [Planctomycetota bacterium]